MNLYYVRHGESEANILEVISNRGCKHGLTEVGRRQAATLGARLQGTGATRIWTSPLLRAVETAEILSEALGVETEVTDALREFDCGIAESRADAEAWQLHRQVMDAWLQRGDLEARIPGGESFADMRDRFVPFVGRLREGDNSGSQILVGHGGLYLCMLPLILSNISAAPEGGFPNTAYVLAKSVPEGLVCLEWCGTVMPALDLSEPNKERLSCTKRLGTAGPSSNLLENQEE